MLHIFCHHIQEFTLSGCLIVGAGTFQQMTGTVKLMGFQQIGPPFLLIFDDKISIQIAIRILCGSHQINQCVCVSLHLFIRKNGKRVGYCFQPFSCIGILEYHAVKAVPFVLPTENIGSIDKVLNYVTFGCIFSSVIQHFILIGNDGILD